jgi:OPT family oligopeptide transporter
MLVVYGAYFGAYTAIITHAVLYHRREISTGFKNLISRKSAFADARDIHTRLMRSYKEVPEWAYFIVLCVSIGIGAATIAVYPTTASPAAALYGVFLAAIFCVPCGIIKAITNIEVTLNVIAELFGGLWFPGNANAMNFFKAYGYITTMHTLHFAQDLKLAHYTHIPPWVTFSCQMFATLVSSFVYTAILNYQMTKIPDVCTSTQKGHFTCPGPNTAFTASVLWGTLGPKKMFGAGAIYNGLLWYFLAGAVLPIPFYFLSRKWKVFRYFHAPVFLYGSFNWAPYNLANIWPAVPIAWLLNYYIKKRYLGWWSKYN